MAEWMASHSLSHQQQTYQPGIVYPTSSTSNVHKQSVSQTYTGGYEEYAIQLSMPPKSSFSQLTNDVYSVHGDDKENFVLIKVVDKSEADHHDRQVVQNKK